MNIDELQSEQTETESPVAEATEAETEDAAQAEEGATDEVTSTPEPADAELTDEESEES